MNCTIFQEHHHLNNNNKKFNTSRNLNVWSGKRGVLLTEEIGGSPGRFSYNIT